MTKFERGKKGDPKSRYNKVTVTVKGDDIEKYSSNLPTADEVLGMVLDPEKDLKHTKSLYVSTQLLMLPDINMRDVVEVQQRINDVFMLHAKLNLNPTVAGLALSLNGMTRETFSKIVNNKPLGGQGLKSKLPEEVIDFLKRVYMALETNYESTMANSNIHPTTGIFLGKNLFGYKDTSESIVTHVKDEEKLDLNDIRKRYSAAIDVEADGLEIVDDDDD